MSCLCHSEMARQNADDIDVDVEPLGMDLLTMIAGTGTFSNAELLMLLEIDLSIEREKIPEHRKYSRFTFDSFENDEFKSFFRFHRDDVQFLCSLLGVSDVYRSPTRTKWTGLEGLCVVLRRLSYPNRLIDLTPLFG